MFILQVIKYQYAMKKSTCHNYKYQHVKYKGESNMRKHHLTYCLEHIDCSAPFVSQC